MAARTFADLSRANKRAPGSRRVRLLPFAATNNNEKPNCTFKRCRLTPGGMGTDYASFLTRWDFFLYAEADRQSAKDCTVFNLNQIHLPSPFPPSLVSPSRSQPLRASALLLFLQCMVGVSLVARGSQWKWQPINSSFYVPPSHILMGVLGETAGALAHLESYVLFWSYN